MKTLTEAWEEAGRPRPPFKYLYDHPEKDRDQWFTVNLVQVTSCSTVFRDDTDWGESFNGNNVKVRKLES